MAWLYGLLIVALGLLTPAHALDSWNAAESFTSASRMARNEPAEWLEALGGMRHMALLTELAARASSDAPDTSTVNTEETPDHENLFPLHTADIVCLLLAAAAIFIAAGGGVGGGGVLVPLFILGLHFKPEHAVALSNITITGSACANLLCNLRRRHPTESRPLIDWDLIIVMEPMTIVGAVLGGFLNKLLPVSITCVLMTLLLFCISYKLWLKGVNVYLAESRTLVADAASLPQYYHTDTHTHGDAHEQETRPEHQLLPRDVDAFAYVTDRAVSRIDAQEPLLSGSLKEPLELTATSPRAAAAADAADAELQAVLLAESKQVPVWKVACMVGLFAWLLVTALVKGRVRCGSPAYWMLVFSIVPPVLFLLYQVTGILVHKRAIKDQSGLPHVDGDIVWTPKTVIQYPALCSMAGVIAGLFGVGGGIIKGPLMLELGVLPDVAAATSTTMILFTSGSASIVYLAWGGVKLDYGILYALTGFGVTLAGQMLTYHIIATLGRRSIIIFAMATLLSIGFFTMIYESSISLNDVVHYGLRHSVGICGAS